MADDLRAVAVPARWRSRQATTLARMHLADLHVGMPRLWIMEAVSAAEGRGHQQHLAVEKLTSALSGCGHLRGSIYPTSAAEVEQTFPARARIGILEALMIKGMRTTCHWTERCGRAALAAN